MPDADANPVEPPTKTSSRSKPDLARYIGAFIAIVFAALYIFGSSYIDGWKSCQTTELSRPNGAMQSTRECVPRSGPDALPFLLIAFLLLLPDIAEIELFGLGKIRRKLDEHSQSQEALRLGQEDLAQKIETISINSQQQNLNVQFANEAGVGKDLIKLQTRVDALEGRQGPSQAPAVEGTSATSDTSSSSALGPGADPLQEVRPWLEFATRLNDPQFQDRIAQATGRPGGAGPPSGLTPRDRHLLDEISNGGTLDLDLVRQWKAEFETSLELLRKGLKVQDQLEPKVLRQTTEIAELLLEQLRKRDLIG